MKAAWFLTVATLPALIACNARESTSSRRSVAPRSDNGIPGPKDDASRVPSAEAQTDTATDTSQDGGSNASTPLIGTRARLAALGAEPCPEANAWLCLNVMMPLDHSQAGGKQISVAFAVLPAPEETRRGSFINIAGGPGYSGIDTFYSWEADDPQIPAMYDVIWFDLRGVKRSGNLECKAAAKAFYSGGLRAANAAEETALAAKAKRFASDCVAEMGVPEDELKHYNTEQAAADIEAFRVLMGDETFVLYGFSYGTQLAQTYARRYPERLQRLILDGVVDLSLSHIGYMKSLNNGVAKILDATFAACGADAACAAPFAGAPGDTPREKLYAALDAVALRLESAPAQIAYPLAAGGVSSRTFARTDLDSLVASSMYEPTVRRDFLAALAVAYNDQDYMPLQTAAYFAAGIDPETADAVGTAGAETEMSNAVYYNVTCNDYGLDAETEAERLKLYLAGGRELREASPRVLSPYYGDLPCVFWPTDKRAAAVPLETLPGVPTMLANAAGDSATPVDQGLTIAKRLADAYSVTAEGGHHVIVGSNECLDAVVIPFIVSGAVPNEREQRCSDVLIAPPDEGGESAE